MANASDFAAMLRFVSEHKITPRIDREFLGLTEEEAITNIREAIAACVEARAASGMPVTISIREAEVAV